MEQRLKIIFNDENSPLINFKYAIDKVEIEKLLMARKN